jgi:hypothetical protein
VAFGLPFVPGANVVTINNAGLPLRILEER